MRILSSISSLIVDFLFPPVAKVIELESLSSADLMRILPGSSYSGNDALVLFDYHNDVVREIVWEIKYAGNRFLADTIGEILYDVIISELEERNDFEKTKSVVLIPMPMSGKRRLERGWNQTELLAEAIKKRDTGRFRYEPGQLVKIRHTESQTRTASRAERRENLKGSMKVQNPLSLKGKYVVLVDDVLTTGSTFAEAKRALREARVSNIFCVAVSH